MKFNGKFYFIVYHWFSIVSISISNKLTINNVEQKYIGLPQMATFRNYEEMDEYINRKSEIISNPLMDSYLSAYNYYHDASNSKDNHLIKKRSADPLDLIKFELSDAKEPNEALKNIVKKHREREQKEIEQLEKDKKLVTIVGTKKKESNHKIEKRSPNPYDLIKFEFSDAKEPDEAFKKILKKYRQREQREYEELENNKKSDTIVDKKKNVRHRIVKRFADPLDYIKFELSDAKEPNEDFREMLRKHIQRESKVIEETGIDKKSSLHAESLQNKTNDMEPSDDDQNINESQLIHFYQPVLKIPVKSKKSMEKFPLPVQKAINMVLSESKHGFRVAPVLPPSPQKYYGDKVIQEKYKLLEQPKQLNSVGIGTTNIKYVYPNYRQHLQYYTLPVYAASPEHFVKNSYQHLNGHDNGKTEQVNTVPAHTNRNIEHGINTHTHGEENFRHAHTIPVHSIGNSGHQISVQAHSDVSAGHVSTIPVHVNENIGNGIGAYAYNNIHSEQVHTVPVHGGRSNEYPNNVHAHIDHNSEHVNNQVVTVIKPQIPPKLATESIKYIYYEAPSQKIVSQESSAAEQAIENYKYISESNALHNDLLAKPLLSNHDYQLNEADGIPKYSVNDNNEKFTYEGSLGNYLQSTAVKDSVSLKKLPENNIDTISNYNALTEKSTTDQLHGLTYLVQNDLKEQSIGGIKRPQDNRAPILFHPELKGKIEKPKNYYINQYGYKQLQPSADIKGNVKDYKPITEPTDEYKKEQVIHVTPQPYKKGHSLGISSNYKLPLQHNLENENYGLKKAYKELLEAKDLQYASKYEFGYRVRDFHTGNDFGHEENVDHDGITRGQYHILLPDGRVQNVRYHADDSGFHADVSFESGHKH